MKDFFFFGVTNGLYCCRVINFVKVCDMGTLSTFWSHGANNLENLHTKRHFSFMLAWSLCLPLNSTSFRQTNWAITSVDFDNYYAHTEKSLRNKILDIIWRTIVSDSYIIQFIQAQDQLQEKWRSKITSYQSLKWRGPACRSWK